MIERQTIDGKEAIVAYFTADLQPTDKDKAAMVKIIYEDGKHVWEMMQEGKNETEDAGWVSPCW